MANEPTPSGSDPSDEGWSHDLPRTPVVADRVGLQLKERSIAARLFGTDPDAEPVTVARFSILRKLGEGGMGVVYAAYDASLDRKVALKLIRASPGESGRRTEARLAAEARAMARLAHPNVATVFEVGEHDGHVFIAMELVPGETLRDWLVVPRTWQQIVAVLIRAGRGLAAAHAAGLVHRDFKPENVMVGPSEAGVDPMVKVMDFGLAQGAAAETWATQHGADDDHRGGARSTVRARWAGTPAYMAPEQIDGNRVDARSDQFSFCVTAYEALCRRRPFRGKGIDELRRAMNAPPPDPPPGIEAPRRVIETIQRGLALDPDARFEDMSTLLRALQHDRWATPRRVMLGVSAIAIVAAGSFSAARWGQSEPCSAPDARVQALWSEHRSERIRQAFDATGVAHAAMSWDATAAIIDDHVARWSRAKTDACRATHIDRTQSEEALELRTACFERRFGELESVLDLLETPDAEIVGRAPVAVSSLRPVSTCADVMNLRERRDAISGLDPLALARLSEALDRGEALLDLGRPARAKQEADAVVGRAETTGDALVLARALLLSGRAGVELGEENDASELLQRAMQEAVAAGDAELLARSATALAEATAEGMDDRDHALDVLGIADGALRRAGDPWAARQAWHDRRGEILRMYGRYQEAAREYGESLRLALDARPARPHLIARAKSRLAHLQMLRGRPKAALEDLMEAVEVYEAELGPTHPACAGMRRMLSSVYLSLQQWTDAEREAKIAIERLEGVFGSEHLQLVPALRSLGVAYHRTGRYDEAEATYLRARDLLRSHRGVGSAQESTLEGDLALLYQRLERLDDAERAVTAAIEITRTHRGTANHALADHLYTLATILAQGGDAKRAKARMEEAFGVLERAGLPEHPVRGRGLTLLGRLAADQGQLEEALEWFTQSAEHFASMGDEHENDRAVSLYFIADLQAKAGQPGEARETYERVLEILDGATGSNPMIDGLASFDLARLLWKVSDQRPRALELAQRAHASLESIDRSRADEIAAWIRAHQR